jgi:4'-phosphopantetheinyl transferase
MVACALAEADVDVGVDVERVDRRVDEADIAGRFFAARESSALARLDGAARRERFFDLWTLKEALVKALGVGLAQRLDAIAFSIGPGGDVQLEAADVDAAAWQFALFAPGPRHRLAVAARRGGGPPLRVAFQRAAPDEIHGARAAR